MLLRRVIKHFRNQEWTAIAIDFVIVVFGVFVGIQVANWNEDQVERAREKLLLGELRGELLESIEQLEIKITAFRQVGRSGERAIAFLDLNADCTDDCWNLVVDFLHASQWQQINVNRSTYDEMRRNGWPRNRKIFAALEAYHLQAVPISQSIAIIPPYRSLVRGLIPITIQKSYWPNCFQMLDGEETYVSDCLQGVPFELAVTSIEAIKAHTEIHPTLTEWASFSYAIEGVLNGLIVSAKNAIALIDTELEANE